MRCCRKFVPICEYNEACCVADVVVFATLALKGDSEKEIFGLTSRTALVPSSETSLGTTSWLFTSPEVDVVVGVDDCPDFGT